MAPVRVPVYVSVYEVGCPTVWNVLARRLWVVVLPAVVLSWMDSIDQTAYSVTVHTSSPGPAAAVVVTVYLSVTVVRMGVFPR
jgi:hypothetical protein